MFRLTYFILFAIINLIALNFALAEDDESNKNSEPVQDAVKSQTRDADEDVVYGWQIMSPKERAEHRTKMRSLKTKSEREAYRLEHHQQMQERAKQKGMTLPDLPMLRGRGLGPRSNQE